MVGSKQAESLPPMYRTVKAAEHRHVIGIDHTKASPRDKGDGVITVIVNMFTGRAMLFPGANPSAEHTLRCIHKYISVNGMIDEIRTDQGVDFTSRAVDQLRRCLDLKHILAIAIDMHFDHHFITDLIFELFTSASKAISFCLICSLTRILNSP